MNKLNIALGVFLIILTCSCDSGQKVSGTVLDKDTKQPIDHVCVNNLDLGEEQTFTDSSGNFTLESHSSSLTYGHMTVDVSHYQKGYKKTRVDIKNGAHDTIYLTKTK
ncbi:MAG: carboxypeptidase-like regulatory domain-containing protein [Bacteroidia bacterium]